MLQEAELRPRFSFRRMTDFSEEMSGQKFKSVGLLVDASPKAGMDVA